MEKGDNHRQETKLLKSWKQIAKEQWMELTRKGECWEGDRRAQF